MASKPRSETVDPDEVATYYCHQRCAAQAFRLDSPDGSNERMDWIRQAQVVLAGLFGIEVGAHRILGNQFSSMLTSRPDIVTSWSDEDVVRRWLKIAVMKRNGRLYADEPTMERVFEELENSARVKRLRRRLGDISWFMGAAAECVSRRINKADDTSGTVWEGAFRCSKLEGAAEEFTCSVCIDLDFGAAVSAGIVESWEYSSLHDRIEGELALQTAEQDHSSEASEQDVAVPLATEASALPERADDWLKPLVRASEGPRLPGIIERSVGSRVSRASDEGLFEDVTLQSYRDLLKWLSDRLLGKPCLEMPEDLADSLRTLGVHPPALIETILRPPRRLVGLRLSREIEVRNAALGLSA